MTLVDEQRYRALTGDTSSTPAAVATALADAHDLVEEAIRRPLESAAVTETLPVYQDGRIYPSAVPVTILPSGYTADGDALVGAVPAIGALGAIPGTLDLGSVTVTYTGGWTSATVPAGLARAIATSAYDQLHRETTLPAGVRSVSQGDASMTFAEPTGPGLLSSTVVASVKRYRPRRAA